MASGKWVVQDFSFSLFVVVGLLMAGLHAISSLLLSFRKGFPPKSGPLSFASVLIQLPIYNEEDSVVGLLDTVSRLRWPAHLLKIQILDDSDDGTSSRIDDWLEIYTGEFHFDLIRREKREHFKAGALMNGLSRAEDYSYVLILDADFRPGCEFLEQMMTRLQANPEWVALQARWEFYNRNQNLLTRLQALAMDTHFAIEQNLRHQWGFMVTFNGTAGLFRKDAIEDAGGFSGEFLTEDLELSCRLFLKQKRIGFAVDIVCPSEIPAVWSSFVRQQERWAQGSLQTVRKWLLTMLLHPDGKALAKVHLLGHLLHYLIHPLLFLVALGHLVGGDSGVWNLPVFWGMIALGTSLIYLRALILLKRRLSEWFLLPGLLLMGGGLMVRLSLACTRGILGKKGEFIRTPKGKGKTRHLGGFWLCAIEIMVGILGFSGLFQKSGYTPGAALGSWIACGACFSGVWGFFEAILVCIWRRKQHASQ